MVTKKIYSFVSSLSTYVSSPRRRGPIHPWLITFPKAKWIPAYAGMTRRMTVMTCRLTAMTRRLAVMTRRLAPMARRLAPMTHRLAPMIRRLAAMACRLIAMTRRLTTMLLLLLFSSHALAQQKIVNVYAWTGEIPESVVRDFQNETGIKVNFSTYENNEIMYAKLRTSQGGAYDIVMPSSYFVDRMRRQNMLEALDKSKLPNWNNLNPSFLHPAYDPQTQFSTPFIWGVTGIFVNNRYFKPNSINKWNDLWRSDLRDKLMLLDDMREVFSMTLISLGYSANDKNQDHIKQAFLKIRELMQNVKVFSTETVVSIIIDEDAMLGMAWNGDTFKAEQENANVQFVFPEDGFVIWVDNLSIPKNAKHKDEAYAFINYLLRPDVAKTIALTTKFPIANLAGQKLLPESVRNNPTIYPPASVLKRGQFQTDVGEDTLALIEQYWEQLKMSG